MTGLPNIWTEEELSRLREEYPKHGRSPTLLKMFPNRTLEGICLKANRLGLKVLNNIRECKTHEWYLDKLMEINSNIVPLVEYAGSTTSIPHECLTCGHTWNTRPQAVLKPGAMCPICRHNVSMLPLLEVDAVLSKAGISRVSEYLGTLKPLKVKHNYCGFEWETKYSNIQQGSGCPKCNVGFGWSEKTTYPEQAYLYLLEIILWGGERFLKVGITSRTSIQPRISEITSHIKDDLLLIKPLGIYLGCGKDVLHLEQLILSTFEKHQTKIIFDGKTELLNIDNIEDIKQLIYKEQNVKDVLSTSKR